MKLPTRKSSRFEDQRTVVIGTQSDAQLWGDLLEEVMVANGRPDGPGWLTINELAALAKMPVRSMRDVIARWITEGKAEATRGRTPTRRMISYYRRIRGTKKPH
jgi:hypothetical protein